jgi:hypothetical protein
MRNATLNVVVSDSTYDWLMRGGQASADLIGSAALDGLNALRSQPLWPHISGVAADGAAEPQGEDAVVRVLGTLQQLMEANARNVEASAKNVDATLVRMTEQRALDAERRIAEQRANAEEAMRNVRTLREQLDQAQNDLEKERLNSAWMLRQSNVRGTVGELSIQDVLMARFPEAEVKYIGDNGKSEGDFLVYVDADRFVSVEAKNAKTLDALQVATTIGHARKLKKAHGDKHLGHVFLSLESTNIPGKGNMTPDLDSVPGITVVWVGLPRLEGHEDLVEFAFRMAWKTAPMHARLKEHGGPEAHKRFFERVKELVLRAQPDMSQLLVMSRNCLEAKKAAEAVYASAQALLKTRLEEYVSMCALVDMAPGVGVPRKEDEEVIWSMAGRELGAKAVRVGAGAVHPPVSKKARVGKGEGGADAARSPAAFDDSARQTLGSGDGASTSGDTVTTDAAADLDERIKDAWKRLTVKSRGAGRPKKESTVAREKAILDASL